MVAPTIALLDNDPAFLALMHTLLSEEGYRTLRWCPSGESDAHVPLRGAQPDLVILDLGLGGARHGGWELVKRLRGDFATTDIPAILLADEAVPAPASAEVLQAIRCRAVRRPFAHGDLRDLRDLYDLLVAIEGALDPSLAMRGAVPCAPAADDRTPRGDHSDVIAGSGLVGLPPVLKGAAKDRQRDDHEAVTVDETAEIVALTLENTTEIHRLAREQAAILAAQDQVLAQQTEMLTLLREHLAKEEQE
jgi:CheY-like chemotaxis protein